MKSILFIFTLGFVCWQCGVGATWAADSSVASDDVGGSFGGHIKYQFIYQSYPEDSVFREELGAAAIDNYLETRFKLSAGRQRWDFKADYQLIGIHADTLRLAGQLPDYSAPVNAVISDKRRWWDLTSTSTDGGSNAFVHRLDRLSVGYTTEHAALRFGRQAISWGNGMIFTPMDVFNPFDPAAVDKEYKTGDDMLYGQYLFAGGDDLQGVAVIRRDPRSGAVERDQSSLAFKYHGFLGMNEIDLLAAEHYGDRMFGFGGIVSLGGAVWRGDLTWTRTESEDVVSAVTSLGYSWTWAGRNVSGLVEYYRNGFGLDDSPYALEDLAQHPDLLRRLERGELFTLGRHYLAASATIEMTPLLLLIPNLFINLGEPSAQVQVVVQYGMTQNLAILCAVNVPLGQSGSEYGGIEAPAEGLYLSSGPSVFGQLAWYF